ncbi:MULTISPECIES: TAXI family TRAP transporter solute-binding subunit [Actinokineospora]|uniref:C4-dicarboxylate ABC transporter substrate-binding protein n=1 Tax=Actinokineospora fastidiosa TaxID=1816 RepID=A0A918GJ71_9PSEU|nr:MULTISPECIES: TAXI family TRAP transporter solute-binding subunit [Actinokineospora]UVS77909.1 TRAP transporter solute receptor, TAXI family [Actinokineospora sp. UTMC 2448]GGS40166.1 C4-dicarboxylate ABC transporter substrate-binding protein [Actinokineospora fastidiosa]
MTRVRLCVVLVALALLTACDTGFEGVRLRIAAGFDGGVYHALSAPLADACRARLGMARPEVLQTRGSPDNLNKLVGGEVDIAFSAADVAAERRPGPRRPMALARLYNDYLHLVVRDEDPIEAVADLAGRRVSIGAPESGVAVMARRVLEVAGLTGGLKTRDLGLAASIDAFNAGDIDAFFWSGGLPTDLIEDLSAIRRIRLIDMTDILPNLINRYPVYNAELIPASTYHLAGPAVNTLSVPNYLLTTDAMPADLAMALVETLFEAQPALVRANKAATAIDIHSAIETDPVPLHPGAVRYYREQKI